MHRGSALSHSLGLEGVYYIRARPLKGARLKPDVRFEPGPFYSCYSNLRFVDFTNCAHLTYSDRTHLSSSAGALPTPSTPAAANLRITSGSRTEATKSRLRRAM